MLNSFERYLTLDHSTVPEKYSINLMWLNRTFDDGQTYITSAQTEQEFVDKILSRGMKWKESNPHAEVAIWYDSEFATPKALENSQRILDKLKEENPSYNFKLKDVRDIDIVKNNPDAFSDNLDIYFRVDLMKLIISVYELESNGMQAVIFSDMDVGEYRKQNGFSTERMTKEELFSPEIMEKLNNIGMQTISYDGRIENQFFQFINKPEIITALKLYINASLSRAMTSMNFKDYSTRLNARMSIGPSVYVMMERQLFPLILGLIEKSITVNERFLVPNSPDKWVPYDVKKHGSDPLGNYYINSYQKAYLYQGEDTPTAQTRHDLQKVIQLPNMSTIDCSDVFGRQDLHTRGGNSHPANQADCRELKNPPANGGEKYQCQHWEMGQKLTDDLSHGPTKSF